MSYSGSRDRTLLPALQKAIERQPRRWYRPPRFRVFLDNSSISIGPKLWEKIESGLRRSRWLVVIASPEAAASKWVDREIAWWIEHRSIETLLLVVSAGELVWNDADHAWDQERSTALPPRLLGHFDAEPVWKSIVWLHSGEGAVSDPDLTAAAVSITSVVRGMPEDDLRSEGLRETRRNLRWAQSAGAVLVFLLVLAIVVAQIAFVQKNHADEQARIASARLMASIADSSMTSDVRVASLLAVAAYRMDPSPRHMSTLLQANAAGRTLVRQVPAEADVVAVETSQDGRTAVAGLANGAIVKWSVTELKTSVVGRLSGAVTAIAVNADASTILAVGGPQVALWRSGSEQVLIDGPADQTPDLVAIAPSGSVAAVHRAPRRGFQQVAGSIQLIDIASGRVTDTRSEDWHPQSVVFLGEDKLALLNGAGTTRLIDIGDWSVTDPSSPLGPCPKTSSIGDPAPNGMFFACTFLKGEAVPVFGLGHGIEPDSRTVDVPQASQVLPAVLSRNSQSAAVLGQDGSIYVAPVAMREQKRSEPVRMTGARVESNRVIRFLGTSERRLVSAYRKHLSVWDVDQIDRLATVTPVPLLAGCNACEPEIFLSPNARTAVVSGAYDGASTFEYAVMFQDLRTTGARARIVPNVEGTPSWSDDGGVVIAAQRVLPGGRPRGKLRLDATTEITVVSPTDDLWTTRTVAYSSSWKAGVTVDGHGDITLFDPATGQVRERIARPSEVGLPTDFPLQVDIRPDGELIAFRDGENVVVFDVRARRVSGTIPGREVLGLWFGGPNLLLQRGSVIEVWRGGGSTPMRTFADNNPAGRARQLASDTSGSVIARRDMAGYITVVDSGGVVLGTFPPIRTEWYAKASIALSDDGRYLTTAVAGLEGGPSGVIVERDISPKGLIKTACARAGDDLTPDEWNELVGIVRPPGARCP
ncbi:TIR domain-containing protein [Nocardia sp. NPDC049526]|uniref:TIR domain-containing protein n=1 Tax=Nocardia sp. NPDC049526 TaxID=3364316 RepID=UPI00378B7943